MGEKGFEWHEFCVLEEEPGAQMGRVQRGGERGESSECAAGLHVELGKSRVKDDSAVLAPPRKDLPSIYQDAG